MVERRRRSHQVHGQMRKEGVINEDIGENTLEYSWIESKIKGPSKFHPHLEGQVTYQIVRPRKHQTRKSINLHKKSVECRKLKEDSS